MINSTSRRKFLKGGVSGAVLGAGLLTGSRGARAADMTRMSGTIVAASGDDVVLDELTVNGRSDFYTTMTDGSGAFELEVPTNGRYDIGFYKASDRNDFEAVQNGIPHIYQFGPFDVNEGPKDLGTLQLPEASLVDVRVLKPNGEPLMGARPGFRYNGWGSNPSRTAINTDGYVVIEGASFTGAEFVDHVTVEIEPPAGDAYDDRTYRRTVDVAGPTTVTATIGSNGATWGIETAATPDQTSATSAATSTTSGVTSRGTTSTNTQPQTSSPSNTPSPGAVSSSETTSTSVSRGFFSNNSGETPAFLDDIFNLTVVGFLLSVAGILQQMMGGR